MKKRSDSETLWSVYQADQESKGTMGQDIDPLRVNPAALLFSMSPDFLWYTMIYALCGFVVLAMIVFGGRDLLLLTGNATINADLVERGESSPCKTRYSQSRMCQTLTYQYIVDGKKYHFTTRVEQGYTPKFKVKYVTWSPSMYKTMK